MQDTFKGTTVESGRTSALQQFTINIFWMFQRGIYKSTVWSILQSYCFDAFFSPPQCTLPHMSKETSSNLLTIRMKSVCSGDSDRLSNNLLFHTLK